MTVGIDRIFIFDQYYDIEEGADQPERDGSDADVYDAIAWTNFGNNTIYFTDIENESVEDHVLMHELMHVVLRVLGIQHVIPAYEEYLCDTLATGLLSLIRLNPGLMQRLADGPPGDA